MLTYTPTDRHTDPLSTYTHLQTRLSYFNNTPFPTRDGVIITDDVDGSG